MRLLAVLAFIGFSAFAAPAISPAHAQVTMKNYNFDEMRLALQEVGSEIQREDADDAGQRFLQARSKSGLVYVVAGRACDNKEPTQRCLGLNISCSFILKPGADTAKALGAASYEALKAYVEDGDLKLGRYVIFDYGITPANLKTNLTVFLDIADKVWGDLGKADLLAPPAPAEAPATTP